MHTPVGGMVAARRNGKAAHDRRPHKATPDELAFLGAMEDARVRCDVSGHELAKVIGVVKSSESSQSNVKRYLQGRVSMRLQQYLRGWRFFRDNYDIDVLRHAQGKLSKGPVRQLVPLAGHLESPGRRFLISLRKMFRRKDMDEEVKALVLRRLDELLPGVIEQARQECLAKLSRTKRRGGA